MFIDYENIKSHYSLIAIDLIRQTELDADAKAIQKIELVGQLKNLDNYNARDAGNSQCLFILTI